MDSYRPILKTVSGICKLHDTYLVGYHLSGEEENQYAFLSACTACLWRRDKKVLTPTVSGEGIGERELGLGEIFAHTSFWT